MTTLADYARHSRYTDPGPHGPLLDALPTDLRELTAVVRNLVVHYRGSGIAFTPARLAEIDNRWVERILACDLERFDAPLDRPRPEEQRVAGCCRDFALLTVAALRHRGVPARSRVGFVGYFDEDFNGDHVVVEYWNGTRWVLVDAQLEPGPQWPFDTCDLPQSAFASAAQVWTAHRRGEVDAERYGVDEPTMRLRGAWFVRDYVVRELAHRQREELLLWDVWGTMISDPAEFHGCDNTVIDEVAALLLAADAGDERAERDLADRYVRDARLNPGGRVLCESPSGQTVRVDLGTQTSEPAVP